MNDIVATEEQFFPIAKANANPLLEEGYFNRTLAVAQQMAMASIIPESLMMDMTANPKVELPFERIVANCMMIVDIANGWGMRAVAVAQATSIVHGRLMFEGKLVAAVLDSVLSVKLKHVFGKWDSDMKETKVGEVTPNEDLSIRVYEELPDGSVGRYVDGYVNGWKTTGVNSAWGKPHDWRKMLFNRGVREWARLHEPGAMLGIMATDEYEPQQQGMRDVTPVRQSSAGDDVLARLRASQSEKTDGFDADRINADTNGGKVDETKSNSDSVSGSAAEEEGHSISNEEPSTGDVANSASPDIAEKEEVQKDLPVANNGRPTAMDWEWLRNLTTSLWAATNPGGDVLVLKAQRNGFLATYPSDAVAMEIREKASAIFDTCMDVVMDRKKPEPMRKYINGLAGFDDKDLPVKKAAAK
jgi:hypothetical protein